MMEGSPALSLTALVIFFISLSVFRQAHGQTNPRQTLEIIIGGGASPPYSPPEYGDCPDCPPSAEPPACPEPAPPPPPPLPSTSPPPPPPSPPPPPPPPSPPPPPPPTPAPPPPPPPPTPSPSPPPPRPPKRPPSPSPRPPPSPSPTPSGPPSLGPLDQSLRVIQAFKKEILCDPKHATKTWRGKLCADKGSYKGFICDNKISDNKPRVALVNFNGFGFCGKPLMLTNILRLTDLIVFHANSNNFTGPVPARISKIPSLYELDLSNNMLKGEFPKAVLTATNLTFLDLRFNKLTGELPPQVFTLDLDVLFLNNNKFVGNIPETLGKTPVLYLTLANNKFTGPIPKSIGQTSDTLLEALLLNNQLSGCLPYEIGLLKKATLFDVSKNRLTGPIPYSFGCLKNMQYLNLSDNQFYGRVPELLCKHRNLVKLSLKLNYFTEVGPECRKLIMNRKLDITMNCIYELPSQRSPAECDAFFSKRMSCPDPKSLFKVPCKIDYSASPEEFPLNRRLMALPRTYEALQRQPALPGILEGEEKFRVEDN